MLRPLQELPEQRLTVVFWRSGFVHKIRETFVHNQDEIVLEREGENV
jgi:hypothetical protein